MPKFKAHPGKLAEYALLLGLLGVLSVASLKLLGVSIFNLLSSASTPELQTKSPMALLQKNTPPPGFLGFYKVSIDPNTGKPVLAIVNSLSGEAKNVTSVDGNQFNTLGEMRLASYLDQLASQETNPENKAYYAQLAKLAYYMGANEGEIDDFDTYTLSSKYSNGDALQDLLNKKQEFQALMLNPPPGLNQQALSDLLPVSSEVFNIAQTYTSALSKYVNADGTVTTNFSTVTSGTKFATGLGSALDPATTTKVARAIYPLTNKTFEDVVPYDALKAQVQTTLSKNTLPQMPIVTDFKDAVVIDTTATPQ
jgi:hypothetical protein